MTVLNQEPVARPNLVTRVKNILLHPAAEWDRIDVEPATVQGLYTGYICILAAIGPICGAIGSLAFGYHILGYYWRPSILTVVTNAVVSYVLQLVMIAVLAVIIDALAPTFGGQKSRIQAFKVAAYGATASWVADVFKIVPPLTILSIVLGLYSLYLLYVGVPKLMRTSQDKALPYVALVVLIAVVLTVIVGVIAAPFEMMGYSRPVLTGLAPGY